MLLEIYLVVVDYLLQTGATPLKWASQLGHKKIVAVLLEHSTNVDMQDKVIAMKQFCLYRIVRIISPCWRW